MSPPSLESSLSSPLVYQVSGSRYFSRWIASKPSHPQELQHLLDNFDFPNSTINLKQFQQLLNTYLVQYPDSSQALTLSLRRLRNLLIAGIIYTSQQRQISLSVVMQSVSHLAEFTIQVLTHHLTLEQIVINGQPIGEHSKEVQALIVIGMGKLGGYELNVSSDIDLIFVYGEEGETQADEKLGQRSLSNHEFFTRIGKKLIAAISEINEEGFCFRVDMALRPNGNSGPLVASLGMLEEYFLVQGREWERYAWVKARAITGRKQDIKELEQLIHAFSYRKYLDYGIIDSLRQMHQQIRTEVLRQEAKHTDRGIHVKLGRGGIREIEFLAQVFQLIRGGREADLRDRSTVTTLHQLSLKNILDRKIVASLLDAYTFLRNTEHAIQYIEDAQTHTLPNHTNDQLFIAQLLGYDDMDSFNKQLLAHNHFVAQQFDFIFKDKNEDTTHHIQASTLSNQTNDALDNDESAHLEAIISTNQRIGFDEPTSIELARCIQESWRSIKIHLLSAHTQEKILTVLNRALKIMAEESRHPVHNLHRLFLLLEKISRRTAYLSLLIEFPHALKRVMRMLDASEWATNFLSQHPILLDELLDENTLFEPINWQDFSKNLHQEMDKHQGDVEAQLDCLREHHHAAQFHLLAQDIENRLSVEQLADELSLLADAIVKAVIHYAWQTVLTKHRDTPLFSVIAYGKLGGKELSYASDLDIIFLYDDEHQDAPSNYAKLAQRFITWMTTPTAHGILYDIDIALRPDGASGLLVSSLQAFEKYQAQSAWIWEHQALTRARYCAGTLEIGERFEHIRHTILGQKREAIALQKAVCDMREKMRNANPVPSEEFDLKHSVGGMIDVEFMVQYSVLLHTSTFPHLSKNLGNIALLRLFAEAHLIDADLAKLVGDTYRDLRKRQHQQRLQGIEKARVPFNDIQAQIFCVKKLWQQLFNQEV